MSSKKLVLGTANLGMPYGISNSTVFDDLNSVEVLEAAQEFGINTYDTAPEYGIAERLLSEQAKKNPDVKIYTKVPSLEKYTYESVSKSIDSSISNLEPGTVQGILFHDPEAYKKLELLDISKRILDQGKITRIGFSAYNEFSVEVAIEKFPCWTLFQVPENILDQRLFHSKILSDISKLNVEIYVRSVFLQGLLITAPSNISPYFKAHTRILSQIHNMAAELNVSEVDLCMNYAHKIPWASGILVAAATRKQLEEIVKYKGVEINVNSLEKLEGNILDPRTWNEKLK